MRAFIDLSLNFAPQLGGKISFDQWFFRFAVSQPG
jgi:hypothetical protein